MRRKYSCVFPLLQCLVPRIYVLIAVVEPAWVNPICPHWGFCSQAVHCCTLFLVMYADILLTHPYDFGRVGPEPLLIFTDNPLLQLRVAAKWMRNSVASQFQPHPTGTKTPTNTIIQRSLCPTHPILNTRPQTTVNVTPPNIPLFPHYNIILVAYITIFVT